MNNYDIIVIGAGNGGLTAAATLTQKGLRVLLLERHNIPGGCATSFCRGRFEFEVALHQLSGLGTPENPGPLRMTLDKINVLNKLEFVPMTDLYRFVMPDKIDITLKPDRAEIIEELQRHFPHEKEGIQQYMDLVYNFFTQVIGVFYLNDPETSRKKYPLYYQYALKTTQEVMDQFIKDPMLQAVLSPFWTYVGLPPSKMAFVDMAAMLFAYIEFIPFHLKGGSQALSNAIADTIIENGGTIRFNCGVKKIIIENSSVKGVITDKGETISAENIISNASKLTTYVDLIDKNNVPEPIIKELKQCSISPSAFTLYMGLDCEPNQVGITESSNFLVPGIDNDYIYERMKEIDIDGRNAMMLSCYNLIDPGFSPPGTSQVALVTLKYGDPWLSVPPGQYVDEKYRVADAMLKVVEKTFPGLRKHIEEIEIATPITHLRYLGTPRGSIYGFENHIKDSSLFIPNESHIKGLYLAGGSVGLCGFQPTLDSGVITAKKLIRDKAA
ncbi:MAG: NAD(P)/FAD-dependent oxidoreductase [Deltaproteobacteria bacterium]|nr:NAD(P)/FAD-dependent oxidoreductase [Deltaproteobacteria bacterium]MBW2217886.1 NAD(P)/FAD-dependent oxidoreductase [Deltaproteobacteria bacterium]